MLGFFFTIMMIGVLMASILIYVVIPKDTEAADSKYGTRETKSEAEAEEGQRAIQQDSLKEVPVPSKGWNGMRAQLQENLSQSQKYRL